MDSERLRRKKRARARKMERRPGEQPPGSSPTFILPMKRRECPRCADHTAGNQEPSRGTCYNCGEELPPLELLHPEMVAPPPPRPLPGPNVPPTPEEERARRRADELAEWFANYHAANPHVYEAFKALAYEVRAEGHKRYGAKTILERLRWESAVRYVNSAHTFKINNNIKDRCSARYARMLMREDPSFIGFFEVRATSTRATRERLREAHRGGGGVSGY